MNNSDLVAVLLVVIAILLCYPIKRRRYVLETCVVIGVGAYAIYDFGPFILGIAVAAYEWISESFGWWRTLGMVCVVLFSAVLTWLFQGDRKENRAIRAGSIEAFNKRVARYERDLHYSHEKAVEVTTRIRDEK